MLHIFKNKPYLVDLIPQNHVDFHSHLLFGIDDGAKTGEDTIYLAQELRKAGCSQCITTPHIMTGIWDNTPLIIEGKLAEAKELLANEKDPIQIHAAAEYFIDDNFQKLFQQEKLLTIKDNYVLVEMSYLNAPLQLYDILFEMQLEGYIPVLAHPERYPFYHNASEHYTKLKNAGCLFQMNLLSAVGYYGKFVTKAAEELLSKGMIDFVGSDIHHKNHTKMLSSKIIVKNGRPIKQALENNAVFRF